VSGLGWWSHEKRRRRDALPAQSMELASTGMEVGGFDPLGWRCVQSRLETGAPLRRAVKGNAQRRRGADGAMIHAANTNSPLRFKWSFFAFLVRAFAAAANS